MEHGGNIGFSLGGINVPQGVLQSLNAFAGRVILLILLLPVFYYSSLLFWRVVYPEGSSPAMLEVASSSQPAKGKDKMRDWRWFSDATPAPAAPKVEPSNLDATLLGVIMRDNNKGLAMIQVKRDPSKIFRVGDEIANAVFLDSIASDRVTLQRDGHYEVLALAKMGADDDSAPVSKPPEKAAAKTKKAVKKAKPPIAASSAEEYKKLIREKPIRLMQMVKFEQYEDEENGFGFALSPRNDEDQALFDGLGLEKGDVLLAANDEVAKKLSTSPKSWKALLRAKQIKLKVLRAGVVQEVTID